MINVHDRAQSQQYQKLLQMCHIWLVQPAALLRKKEIQAINSPVT